MKLCIDIETRHVFVKHGCPRRQQSQTMAKISKSYILTPPQPQGHVMSVKCEQPLDKLTVQVWLLYDHQNFKEFTLFISGTELRTDGQTDGRTDDPNTRCPRRTFQAGGIKIGDNISFSLKVIRRYYPDSALNSAFPTTTFSDHGTLLSQI